MIKLGDKVKDVVTGFKGVVMSHIEYFTQCDQYGVCPKTKDGKTREWVYFDESRLKKLRGSIKLPQTADRSTGADGNVPSNH